jgi:hypothetical protein
MIPQQSTRGVSLCFLVFLAAATSVRAEPADIPALIDKLVEVAEDSVASNRRWSFGAAFAPLETEGWTPVAAGDVPGYLPLPRSCGP